MRIDSLFGKVSGFGLGLLVLVASCLGGCGGGSTAPTLQSIAVTPANPSVLPGASRQLTATGTYSDGSTQNITATVSWSSGMAAVATVGVLAYGESITLLKLAGIAFVGVGVIMLSFAVSLTISRTNKFIA